ncbi:hypothetical protein B566_EDAN005353 [Ephemera danica]|nr:hypothetical protein B566_EDAN005353 [Ephemera danica]
MDKETRFLLRKFLIDAVCMGVVAFPLLMFKLFGEPFKRGFFCNDESISHPYRENTIASLALYFIGFGVPIFIILCTEYWRTTKRTINDERQPNVVAGHDIPTWLWECYKVIGVFCFGAACSQLTTDIAKYAIGRLRPHFMDICKPNIDCTLAENLHRYIEDFECMGTNTHRIHDSRLSFLSGHSSFSAYTMIFLALYVHSRWTWRGSKLARHLVQFLAFSMAWYTALSRISDYKHHWSDVLAGSFQGSLFAVLIVVYVTELFPRQRYNYEQKSLNNSVLPMVQQEQKTTMEIDP